ncbi:hypothetical protein [Spirosoma flavus]
MNHQEMVLNIGDDSPIPVWDKLIGIYEQLEGWLGFGEGGAFGEKGIPYWFSYNTDEKYVDASVEPPGLQVAGLMDDDEWAVWAAAFKRIASETLGYDVVDIYDS